MTAVHPEFGDHRDVPPAISHCRERFPGGEPSDHVQSDVSRSFGHDLGALAGSELHSE